MPDEKQTTELITELETGNGNDVSVKAAANLMLAEDALLADINKQFALDKDLVWRLRPFQQGSFEIVMELAVVAAPLLADSPLFIAAFRALKEFLSFKSQLAGRKYTITGNNVIVVEHGENFQVSPIGITLFDPKSKGAQAAERAFDNLATDPNVVGVCFSRAGEVEPFSRVSKEAFGSFHVPETLGPSRRKEIRATIGIRQPAFDRRLVWRFLLDGRKIEAKMADETFLKLSTTGVESFSQKDSLDVSLEITEEQDPVSQHWIKRSYVITKVWEHIRPPKQLELEDTDS